VILDPGPKRAGTDPLQRSPGVIQDECNPVALEYFSTMQVAAEVIGKVRDDPVFAR
jgi:hypothetical protein